MATTSPQTQQQTSAAWTPPSNQLSSRPFETTEQSGVDSSPKALQSRPFFSGATNSGSVPHLQARSNSEQQNNDDLFDLTKINLFAGAAASEPPSPPIQRSESSIDAANGINKEQEEQESQIQRKCASCAVEDEENNLGTGIQAKLTIGQPGDKYEQEADRVAAQVVQRLNEPNTSIRRSRDPDVAHNSVSPSITKLQRQSSNVPEDASSEVEKSIATTKGQGQPLSDDVRSPIENAFGADFSGVRIHTDSQADQLNQSVQAKAFTTGQDIYFRSGAYEPGSLGGQKLLAHELTHVVQQGGSTLRRKPHKYDSAHSELDQVSYASELIQAKQLEPKESEEILEQEGELELDQFDKSAHDLPVEESVEGVDKSKSVEDNELSDANIPETAESSYDENDELDTLENVDEDVSDAVQDLGQETNSSNLDASGEETEPVSVDASAIEAEANINETVKPSVGLEKDTIDSSSTGKLDTSMGAVDEPQPGDTASGEMAQVQATDSGLPNMPEPAVASLETLAPPPMPNSPELAETAQQLLQTLDKEKGLFRQAIAVERQQISAETEANDQAVLIDTQTKVQALTASISAKQAEVNQSFTTAKATVQGNITSQKAVAQSEGTKTLGSLKQEVAGKRKAAITTAKEQAEKINQSGTGEANRATASATESAKRIQAVAAQQIGRYTGRKPKVQKAVRKAVQKAAAKAINKIRTRSQKLAKDAKSASSKTSQEFVKAGTKLSAELGKGQDQVVKSIKQGTTSTISSLGTQEQQQLKQLSTLNAKTTASLSQLKAKATGGLNQAGQSAAKGIRNAGKMALTQFDHAEAASVGQLDKETYQVVEQLQQLPQDGQVNKDKLQEFKQLTKGGIQQAQIKLGAAVKEKASKLKSGLNQAQQTSTNKLGEAQTKIDAQISQTVTPIKSGLAQVPVEAKKTAQQTVKINKDTNQDAIRQFGGGLQGEIDKARQTWIKERENVNNDIQSKVTEGIKGNKDAASNAQTDLAKVAQEAADKADSSIWRGIWNGILNVLKVLALFAVLTLVVFAAGLLLVKFGIISGITLLVAAAIVGVGFLIYGAIMSGIHRVQELIAFLQTDAPWYRKVLAVFNVPGAIVADVLGVGAILEGSFNQSILTGEDLNLNPEQRAEKITEGVLSVALMFLFAKVAKAPAGRPRPGGVKGGGTKPPRTKHPKTKPPKTETPKPETPKTETPKPETPKPETPGKGKKGGVAKSKVLAEKTTVDGHHRIKVTEKGHVRCSPSCADLETTYPDELSQRPGLRKRLDKAKVAEEKAPEAVADELKAIDAELASVRRANLKDAQAESRGKIEEIGDLLSKKESTDKLSGKDKGEFAESNRQLEREWRDTEAVAKSSKGDPDLEGLAKEEFESISSRAKALESDIRKKLAGPEEPAYIKENRTPHDHETFLTDDTVYTRIGRQQQGREVYTDGNKYYYVDNFHKGKGSEIEVFNSRGEHLGTQHPDGTPKDGPIKGRTIDVN